MGQAVSLESWRMERRPVGLEQSAVVQQQEMRWERHHAGPQGATTGSRQEKNDFNFLSAVVLPLVSPVVSQDFFR